MTKRVLPIRVQHGATQIGRHVATWRKLQNLTAEQVAERANVSRTTLRRLEQGDAGVGLGVFLSVARALGQLDRVVEILDPYTTDLGRQGRGNPSRARPTVTSSGITQLEVAVDLDGRTVPAATAYVTERRGVVSTALTP